MSQRHSQLKLTKPQHRILDDAVRNGMIVVYGRSGTAIHNLQQAGLVSADWDIEPSAQGGRLRITVWPSDAGKDLIYGY